MMPPQMSLIDEATASSEEAALIEQARAYYQAIAVCAEAGGRVQEALFTAMPAEVRGEMGGDMMAALDNVGG